MFVVYMFQGIVVVNIQSAYATSLGTSRTRFYRGSPNVWPAHAVSTHLEGTCEMLVWSNHRPPCPSPSLKCYSISALENPQQDPYATLYTFIRLDGNILSIYSNPSRLGQSTFWMGYDQIAVQLYSTCIERLNPYPL